MRKNIKFQFSKVAIPNHDKFVRNCCQAWERIAGRAPSDSNVRMLITHNGKEFLVKVALASQQLMFSVESAAHSPFTALEEVLESSMERVQKWSQTRSLKTA